MRRTGSALLFPALALGSLLACSPLIRVRARVERVDGAPLDVGQVVVRVRTHCHGEAGALVAPDAGPPERDPRLDPDASAVRSPMWNVSTPSVEEGRIAFDVHGGVCDLVMTAWLDTNRDGVVGAGDQVGSLGPVQVSDRGLCAGNLNEVGPIRMSAVAP